jgi:hypothetical protein
MQDQMHDEGIRGRRRQTNAEDKEASVEEEEQEGQTGLVNRRLDRLTRRLAKHCTPSGYPGGKASRVEAASFRTRASGSENVVVMIPVHEGGS